MCLDHCPRPLSGQVTFFHVAIVTSGCSQTQGGDMHQCTLRGAGGTWGDPGGVQGDLEWTREGRWPPGS